MKLLLLCLAAGLSAAAAVEAAALPGEWARWADVAAHGLVSKGRQLAASGPGGAPARPAVVSRNVVPARVGSPPPPGAYGAAPLSVSGAYGTARLSTPGAYGGIPSPPFLDCSNCTASWAYPAATNTTCETAGCSGYECMAGYLDCGSGPPGCIIAKHSDSNNCGGCGIVCAKSDMCCDGVCMAPSQCR